jgi:hypothetical protein
MTTDTQRTTPSPNGPHLTGRSQGASTTPLRVTPRGGALVLTPVEKRYGANSGIPRPCITGGGGAVTRP